MSHSRLPTYKIGSGVPALPGVRNVIAVASGKGGVGKSTVAANLAISLASAGYRIGLMDADVYGPSVGVLFDAKAPAATPDGKQLLPLARFGVQTMSMAYLVDESQPMIWRGPMASRALLQLLEQTLWDDLDILFLDLPPGTGDIQLSLVQKVPITASIVVTTGQGLALTDVSRALEMFHKVRVSILGLVNNMSAMTCGHCEQVTRLFPMEPLLALAQEHQLPILSEIPLEPCISQSDQAILGLDAAPEALKTIYRDCGAAVLKQLETLSADRSRRFPKIIVE